MTRVVASAAYTRNTQNDGFLIDTSTPQVPRTSLDGLVATEAFNVKLTSRPTKKLNLSFAYKFDEHDNRTPVSTYAFYDANAAPSGTNINSAFATALGVPAALLSDNVNVNSNRPYSRRLNQFNADIGQVTVTHAVDSNNVFGGNYVNSPLAVAGAPAGTTAAFYIPTSPLPPVLDDVLEVRLTARYAFSKVSTLRLTYTSPT